MMLKASAFVAWLWIAATMLIGLVRTGTSDWWLVYGLIAALIGLAHAAFAEGEGAR